ncbi:hypothetical protein ABZ412_04275 [Nocardia sp. NPDC005746]|uniref:WD40/YVTN/BNR-like repeat-containing protein n=1 Tax=Nocardia sp. NPDC005746 TaxID=3157062 RepID=UPI0033D96A56
MRLRANPVVLAGVIGVGMPVLAAGVIAGLTMDDGDSGPDSASGASAAPDAAVTPRPISAAPTATPAATRAADPDPVGFQPDSINFVSADEGWVLGRSYPCPALLCQSLRHTTDGGRTWRETPLPAPLRDAGHHGGWVKFADARNGWIGTRDTLFATHDGGSTWREIDVDIKTAEPAWSLTVSEDTVWVASARADERTALFTSPITRDAWTGPVEVAVPGAGGPYPVPEVSVTGSRAWMVVTGRGRSGARMVDGTWTPWQLPCGGNGPADWHAVSEKRLVALCGLPASGDGGTTRVVTSVDGGVTFTETGQLSPSRSVKAVLLAADGNHLVAAVDERLLTSTDGGETWTTAYTAPDRGWQPLSGEFVTETTGFVVLGHPGSGPVPTMMLATRDGGQSWTPVGFG